jgi:hypothetical protein
MVARSPAHGTARGAIATSLARLALVAVLVSRLGTPAQAAGGPFYTRASVGLPMPPLHLVQVRRGRCTGHSGRLQPQHPAGLATTPAPTRRRPAPSQVPGISPDRYLAFGLSRDAVVIDVLPEQAGAAPDIA